jgi:hypothetical protein
MVDNSSSVSNDSPLIVECSHILQQKFLYIQQISIILPH